MVPTPTPKEKYRRFCESRDDVPVFSSPWFLDATSPLNDWDVVVEEKSGEIVAALPYSLQKKRGLSIVGQPGLAQKLGVTFYGMDHMGASKLVSMKRKLTASLVEQLPRHSIFVQTFNHDFTDWLSLYWMGFRQSTRYTYIIPDLTSLDEVVKGFVGGKRTDLRKAEGTLRLERGAGPGDVHDFHSACLAKRDRRIGYSQASLERLFSSDAYGVGLEVLSALDEDGNIHGMFVLVWDSSATYLLLTANNPDFGGSGASTFLIREAIRVASTHSRSFDFEGSMIREVEFSYRQFGGTQTPLFDLSRVNNRLLRSALVLAGKM